MVALYVLSVQGCSTFEISSYSPQVIVCYSPSSILNLVYTLPYFQSREFNHRIKGIGHSSFTAEEADFVAAHGNDQVNNVYLSKYDASYDRMHAPDATYGSVDPALLRTWLRRKYVEKAWYKVESSLEEKLGHSLKIAAGDQAPAGVGTKATIVKIPPKSSNAPASASNDFFLDGNIGKTSQMSNYPSVTAPVDDSWDAFGSRGSQFDASFGTSASPIVQPTVRTQEVQASLFQADFDNLDLQNSSITIGHQAGVNVERGATVQVNHIDLNKITHTSPTQIVHYSTMSSRPQYIDSSHQNNHSPLEPNSNFNSYSISTGVNQPHAIIGGPQPINVSLQHLGHKKSPDMEAVDPIGAAFDSLVTPMASISMGTPSHALHAASGSEEILEINSLLQRCTKEQLQHVLQYLRHVVPQSIVSNVCSVEKKGNPFDF